MLSQQSVLGLGCQHRAKTHALQSTNQVDYINLKQNRRIRFQKAGAAAAGSAPDDKGPVGAGLPAEAAGGGGGGSGGGSSDGEGDVPADPPQATPGWTATEVNP